MTTEEAKTRLKRARSCVFAITRELNKIDELWRKLCAPNGPRWTFELRGTAPSTFRAELFDRLAAREAEAEELYDFVRAVERELRLLSRSFPDEAQVLDLHYLDRCSFKEIAEKLHFSVVWVRKLCSRGLSEYAKRL